VSLVEGTGQTSWSQPTFGLFGCRLSGLGWTQGEIFALDVFAHSSKSGGRSEPCFSAPDLTCLHGPFLLLERALADASPSRHRPLAAADTEWEHTEITPTPPHPTPFSCESFSLVLCRYQGVEHERHIIIQGQSRGKSNLGGPFSRDANSVAMTDCQWNHDNKGQLATHIHHEHMT
jgi:hypothetical protein